MYSETQGDRGTETNTESFFTVLPVVLDVMLEFREQKHFSDGRKDLRIFLQCLAPHLGKRVVGLWHALCWCASAKRLIGSTALHLDLLWW